MLYKNILGVFCAKTSLWGHQRLILHLVKMAFFSSQAVNSAFC